MDSFFFKMNPLHGDSLIFLGHYHDAGLLEHWFPVNRVAFDNLETTTLIQADNTA
jgi:hypothetical protein